MKNKLSCVYIFVFLGILLVPLVLYPLIRDELDHSNYENRSLLTWEDVTANSDWKTLFPNVETYIVDNTLYKNESVRLIDWIDENVFCDLFNARVLVGKENWLFYKNEKCIQDYRGGYQLDDQQLQAYAQAAERLQKTLGDKGVRVIYLITPNKETIYGEKYLPDRVKRISTISRADQIAEYLNRHTDCEVIYPKDELAAQAAECQIWRKYDTHWNTIGAFIESQDFLKKTGRPYSELNDVTVTQAGHVSGDLANMLGMGTRFSDDIEFSVGDYLPEVNYDMIEAVEQPNLSFAKFESDSPNEETILFIGDSFLGFMEQFIAKNYRTSIFVHRDNYASLDRDLLMDDKPDIVVLQTAERFIGSYGNVMNAFAETYEKYDSDQAYD